jgi:hypothetical protein
MGVWCGRFSRENGITGRAYEVSTRSPQRHTATASRYNLFCLAILLTSAITTPDDPARSIAVQNPQRLMGAAVPCDRVALGKPDDYKPCIARLPNSELLLTAIHQYKRDGSQVMEQTLLLRSKDGGQT